MTISKFNPKTFAMAVAEKGTLSSEKLNAFTEAIAVDMASLRDKLNNYILKTMNSLPSDFDPSTDTFDGHAIYLNSNAKDSDNNVFWFEHPTDSSQSRPLTIYEAMLLFLQVLANIENGMREGVKLGDVTNKLEFSGNETKQYPWLYADGLHKVFLFEESGNQIKPISDADFNVYIDTTTTDHNLTVVNNTISTKRIWGYVWHPVLSF